jgi:hypothetical protein
MLQKLQESVAPTKSSNLAGAFSRLGWVGFWLQLVFGSFPILGLISLLAFSRPDPDASRSLDLVQILTIINTVMLLFTAFWFYRYTRLARQMRDPQRSPSVSALVGTVWTGVVATTAGMLFSMFAILLQTSNLLFYFMKAPQAGIPVIQATGAASTHWVSTVDMLCLMNLTLFLFAEVIVLIFGLWLLFRTTTQAAESAQLPGPEVSPAATA